MKCPECRGVSDTHAEECSRYSREARARMERFRMKKPGDPWCGYHQDNPKFCGCAKRSEVS
jgi:hypothetical protein